ncbi:hypothetical protein BJ165DRAFT_1614386 [Panaeolus papilionaceus]|nr:hypothetical protein BJ165DRAFT_1614386 [Panaeolus papilionaceus]
MSDLPPGPQLSLSTSVASSPESAQSNVYTIKPIELNDIHDDDKIIVLLGRTGVGKSNYIETLANTDLDISSFGLQRGTNDFTLYRVYDHPTWKDRIVLADTPGFQDATLSEYGAVKAIRHWIKTSKAPPLHALFYLDRITDPFKGGDKPCWDLFTILCGEGGAKRACLVTTAWDLVGHQEGTVSEATAKRTQLAAEKKREQLRTHWEAYLGKGLQLFEFRNTAASANKILDTALNPVQTDHERFILENMKTSLTKPPVLTPIFHLLADRYQSIILDISNFQDDLRGGSYSEEIMEKERVRLQALRVDLEKLRSEMWDFRDGRKILIKDYFSSIPLVVVSKATSVMTIHWSRIRASRPLPHGQTSGNVPDKAFEPLPDPDSIVDVVQCVIGATRAGKTTFIESCKMSKVKLSTASTHSLQSDARRLDIELHIVKFPEVGGRLVLVDTPGLDDPDQPIQEALETISKYLQNIFSQGRRMDGLIYLHRITDIRFDAGSATMLDSTKKLYSDDGYDKLALVTTMWNNVNIESKSQYKEKEKELEEYAWHSFLRHKDPAIVARYEHDDVDGTRAGESARHVVARLLLNLKH